MAVTEVRAAAGVAAGRAPGWTTVRALGHRLRQLTAAALWFVQELSGQTAYEHYVARHRLAAGPGDTCPPLSAADFWRARGNEEPPPRCC